MAIPNPDSIFIFMAANAANVLTIMARKLPIPKTIGLGGLAFLFVCVLAFFWWLMLGITLQYIPPRDDVAFLRIKQDYIGNPYWKMAFFTHVFASMFVLTAGFTQFWRGILKNAPRLHRWMGRLYVVDVLFVTGPASFIMALNANGGFSSRLSFSLLAALWIGTTAMAWRKVVQRNFRSHREWMIRSYALTLSAVALRAWKWGIVMLFHPHPMDVYRLAAWLCWVPNLIIAEWRIRGTRVAEQPGGAIASADESAGTARAAGGNGPVPEGRGGAGAGANAGPAGFNAGLL